MNIIKTNAQAMYGDIKIGYVFYYDNTYWIALNWDTRMNCYPCMCIADSNEHPYYEVGDLNYDIAETDIVTICKTCQV